MKSTGMIKSNLSDNKSYHSIRSLCLTLLLLITLVIGFTSPLWAANEGPNIPISVEDGATAPDTATLLDDDQQNPFVIAVPDKNKWFVVWEDWRNWSTSGADIYGRFINGDGSYCGDEIAISTAAGNQTVPTLAYRNDPTDTHDNILIAWQSTAGNFLSYNILEISSLAVDCVSGATLGSETQVAYTPIAADTLLSRTLPKAAYDVVRDQFWLVWVESRDALQRIEEQPFGVAPITASWNFADSNYIGYGLVNADTGGFTSSDIIHNSSAYAYTRTVRLISHSRTTSADTYVYEFFQNVNNVTVSCDESSPETLIVWEGVRGRATLTCTYDNVTGGIDDTPDPGDKFFSKLALDKWENDDGLVHIFSVFDKYIPQTVVQSQLIDSSSKNSFYPAVAFDAVHRKFLVAWEDRDARGGAGDGIHSKIFGQLIYSGGGLYGNNIPISFQDTNNDGVQDPNILNSNQTRPQISIDPTNQRFFVTWQDGRNSQVSLENLDIYGQFVDSEGSLRGNNYAVCVEPANQYNPVTAYNLSNHLFLSVWKDARNLNKTNSDIYGQRFTLGQPQLILLNEDDTPLVPPLLDFGAIQAGKSPIKLIKLKNVGDKTVHVDSVSPYPLVAPYSYSALPVELESSDGNTIDLVPGASFNLYIKFEPTEAGTYIDKFEIKSDTTGLTVNLQGIQVSEPPSVAGITVEPGSGDFGDVNVGEDKSIIFMFTNTGNVDLVVQGIDAPNSGFTFSGLANGDTIGVDQSVAVLVKFLPTQIRSYSEILRVFYDKGAEPSEISLIGNGADVPPADVISVSPAAGDFGEVKVGTTRSMIFTFSNNGNFAVKVVGTDEPGSPFTISGLPGSIEAGQDVSVLVKFSPTEKGSFSEIYRVLYDYGIDLTEINLTGSGADTTVPLDGIYISPESKAHDFGSVKVGESSSTVFTFTNLNSFAVDVVSINEPTDYFDIGSFPASINPGEMVSLTVFFDPTVVGSFSSKITINYGQNQDPQEISLQGRGTTEDTLPPDPGQSIVVTNPQSLNFGSVNLDEMGIRHLTVTNMGKYPVTIGEYEVKPNAYDEIFSIVGLKGVEIGAGESIIPIVKFTPLQARPYNGNMYVDYTYVVNEGAGSVPGDIASFSGDTNTRTRPFTTTGPWEIQWNTTGAGNFSITIYEDDGSYFGLAANHIGSGSGTSYYAKAGKYFLDVTANGSWAVNIVSVGHPAGSNGENVGAFQVGLAGSGVGSNLVSITTPRNTNFGNVAVGDSRSANLTFTNLGNVDVEITSIDLAEDAGFSVTGIPATILVGETLTALATFSPTLGQSYAKTLRILYDHNVPTSEIILSGVGVFNVNNIIDVSGDVTLGSCNIGESKSANLRFINKGSVDVNITAVDLPEGVFAVNGIPGSIPAYGVLDALVTFTPLLEKDYEITMRVLYDQGVVTSDVKLKGTGIDISAPAVTVAPQSFSFGKTALGTTKTETLVVTNTGNVDLEIVGVDLPGALFAVEGISNGSLKAGMSTVGIVTFTPVSAGDFSGVLRLLFDHDLAPQEIMMQGSAVDIDVSPLVLQFPNSDIDSNTVLSVTITNSSDADIQVKGAVTGTDSYSVSGIVAGDIIRASGGSLTCQVTFNPTAPGYLEDGLYFNVGPVQDLANIPFEEIDWGTQYVVLLKGVANADFVVSDFDTYTADIEYKVSVSASTAAKGQLFVLFSHDPLSKGDIYALTPNGTLKLFPYKASFGWQSLWYKAGAAPGLKLDLSQVDFRELGCSQCQGEKTDNGDNDFHFGNIIITPPDDEVFNNASDFKYMPGTLYLGTYVKDAGGSGVFNFNKGLLEMQSLHINSLAGTWQVTSSYNGSDRIHPTHLLVTEDGDGNISAFWPDYNVTMNYATDTSGYVITFIMNGIYHYTYNITSLTADEFSGTYTCVANGEVLEEAPMSGVRLQ